MIPLARYKAAIRAADDPAALTDAMSAIRADMGFAGFTYACVRTVETRHPVPVPLDAQRIALTDQPPDWVARYTERAYYRADPVLRVAMGRLTPVAWGPDFLEGRRSTDEEAMFRDGLDWGIRHGLCVVVRAPDGTLGVLGLTNPHPVAALTDDPTAADIFHLTAIALHDHVRRTFCPQPPARPPLTRRELDVVAWSAQGKTAAEISIILGITPRTVNAHLATAMDKFGVHSKTHAVARYLTGLL